MFVSKFDLLHTGTMFSKLLLRRNEVAPIEGLQEFQQSKFGF